MKINFTRKEYQQLVTMIEIADWVMTAHHDIKPKETEVYRVLKNKIFSHFKEMGMEECFIQDGDNYFETREYEENAEFTAFVEAYDDDSFWEQLMTRLTDRDYYNQYGNEKVDMLTRMRRFSEIEEGYANEIEKFGLSNFMIANKTKT